MSVIAWPSRFWTWNQFCTSEGTWKWLKGTDAPYTAWFLIQPGSIYIFYGTNNGINFKGKRCAKHVGHSKKDLGCRSCQNCFYQGLRGCLCKLDILIKFNKTVQLPNNMFLLCGKPSQNGISELICYKGYPYWDEDYVFRKQKIELYKEGHNKERSSEYLHCECSSAAVVWPCVVLQ